MRFYRVKIFKMDKKLLLLFVDSGRYPTLTVFNKEKLGVELALELAEMLAIFLGNIKRGCEITK